ncbi:uncharacterized protein BDZ99DRAFT_457995 [Mytilinidion resinicola]|uniref:F-box domain-containing protein n=1 Tax=Mytilinidion resinicola TaxID=574789 RepID=A0A6A6Z5Y8_9PEZI|nr:uncharacterized protein BDZ99DRAFT_457995 [Mytilinidion resinicola]KAF2816083.1 hypothetical protein BDZ99DRAFT_457995 [Mytilinidion resinicola]
MEAHPLPGISHEEPYFTAMEPFQSIKSQQHSKTGPVPPPQPNSSPTQPQPQCLFFSLPAELRNQIYTAVFSTKTPIKNALSLLSTCRLIHAEATVFAYATITWVTTKSDYYSLAKSASTLPRAQFTAITHIAYSSRSDYSSIWELSAFIANAVFHFPGLRTVTLLVRRTDHSTIHRGRISSTPGIPVEIDDWFAKTIRVFMSGRALTWPKERPWRVEWPAGRPDSGQFEQWTVLPEDEEMWMRCVVSRDGEGVGRAETRVEVKNEFRAPWAGKPEFVPWEPPAEKLPVTVIGEADRPRGIQWDGSPEWWVEKRKREKGWLWWLS